MRKIMSLAFLVIVLTACKKEKVQKTVTPDPEPKVYANFIFKMYGQQFYPEFYPSMHFDGTIAQRGFVNESFGEFGIYVPDYLGPGTYDMAEPPGRISFERILGLTSYISTSGSATIVSHDTINKKITGFFNCTLTSAGNTQEISVTDGEFNISYN